jgi:hypothetical protein
MIRSSSLALAFGALALLATAAHAADQPPVIIYTPVAPTTGLALAPTAAATDVVKRFPIVIQQKNPAEYPIQVAQAHPELFPIRIIQPGQAPDGSAPPVLRLQPILPRTPLVLTRPQR